MNTLLIGRNVLLFLFVMAAGVFLVSPTLAQETQNTRIVGTIEVADDADFTGLAQITLEEARAAALAEVPGSTYSGGELDEEDGYLVYEIELKHEGQEVDVIIDAGNASVLDVDRDDDDDDDDD